jgi:ParB family chromosome partitioning protein
MNAQSEPAAVYMATKDLVPWARNPRNNEEAVRSVADSIRRFGFGAPIVARKSDKQVIAGHTRLLAAKMLGLKQVPVRLLDVSDRDSELLALADNKLGEIAEWDNAELSRILSDYGFQDVGMAGWDFKELGSLAEALDPSTKTKAGGSLTDVPLDFNRFEIVVSGPLDAQLAVTEALNGIDGIAIEAKT